MAAQLHDPAVHRSIETRLRALTPSSRGQWGKMSVGQMLWHVNQAMADSLGIISVPRKPFPVPKFLMKFFTLNMPWPKGAPTNPGFIPQGEHDFSSEHARCLELVGKIVARPLAEAGHRHPIFGKMTGSEVSRLHAKHLDHHLRQFGV